MENKNVGACPKCGNSEWETHIVKNVEKDGVGKVLVKWCLCLPWGLYSLFNKNESNEIVQVCKKCGYKR